LEFGGDMKYNWFGDLNDDCTMQICGYMGRAECLGEMTVVYDEDNEPPMLLEYWYCAVFGPGGEMLFHNGEPGGFVIGGDMARAICEAIISAAMGR